jgi:hypothetical protein
LETSLVDGALKLVDRLAADSDTSPALYCEATCVYGRMLLVWGLLKLGQEPSRVMFLFTLQQKESLLGQFLLP